MFEKVKQFFFEKKNQKTFAPLREVFQTPVTSGAEKFFAELGAPMTERQRGLNRAAQLWFKKATAFSLNLGFQQ